MADETAEGRSIAVLAKRRFGLRGRDLEQIKPHFVPFSARTRMSRRQSSAISSIAVPVT